MKWLEAETLPEECEDCVQVDCYNCDMAGQRWILSKEEELKISRKMLVCAIERLERKIAEIDLQLEKLQKRDC